jgi:hypothetical protein
MAVRVFWQLRGMESVCGLVRSKLFWHGRFVRFHVDLSHWQPRGPMAGSGVEAREGTLDELRKFRRTTPGLPKEFFTDRTHGVRRFYLGLADGRIGHISWVFTSANRPLQIRLAPDEIMLDGAYTLPASRGRGLLSAVERVILDDAKKEGKRHAYTHVSVDNAASLNGVLKTGFRPIGILGWRWLLGVPILHFDDSSASLAEAERLLVPRTAAQ